MSSDTQIVWQPQPEAAAWLQESLESLRSDNKFIWRLSQRLLEDTGTRLLDWLDHMAFPHLKLRGNFLGELGFDEHDGVWVHHAGMFPAVYEVSSGTRLAVRVESVSDFLTAYLPHRSVAIEGPEVADVRRAMVDQEGEIEVWVVEQCGTRRWTPRPVPGDIGEKMARHLEVFRHRPRSFSSLAEGFDKTRVLLESAIADLGVPRTCHAFFATEREYWQSRNRAAQVQKERQDSLGLGWANHDHHTYRSSREAFPLLVSTLELLGFVCRERFYAGREAGWGAQVLENRACRLVVFADVDLAADEVSEDFAHQPLPPRAELGTVGLWCELHGEAFLQAGLHHLECQFDFQEAQRQLADCNVATMAPFTDLPYLKQAFTVGETWSVAPDRLAAALKRGAIDETQSKQFRSAGVLGSHLEILQREDGYKGFNQSGISEIIRDTDPRQQQSGAEQ